MNNSLSCRLLAILLLFAVAGANALAATARPPNIIFIIADDMYRDMFNCTPDGRGRNVTPTLDRLTAEGVVLQGQHIVSPVCTPSRFNCLTGRYASRARNAAFSQMTERGGMSLVVWNTMLLADDVTLPRLLQKAGYPAYWDADQLYDLSADPHEQRNLAKDPAHAAKQEELKRELRRHLEKLPGGFGELKPAR